MARVARVNNVGPKYVEVLMAAGIDGPKSLFEFTPETLLKRLASDGREEADGANAHGSGIGTWFMDAKPAVAVAV